MESNDTAENAQEAPRTGEPDGERRFRRRVGISLAALTMLGAWIAVLATNAGTNESATAREATRLASQAQTADVLSKGIESGLDRIAVEVELLATREVFQDDGLAVELGARPDPDLARQRLEEARAEVDSALGPTDARQAERAIEARRLSLEQAVVVDQRIAWNAYASQYETVLTVLAVAIFLVGFTLVLGRKLRPPVAVPGMILAVICAGWAVQIYLKPVPEVSDDAVTATASGDYAVADGRASDAVSDYARALESTPDYVEAQAGRSLAILLEANPDLQNTTAFTDTSPEVVRAAAFDVDAALGSGADPEYAVLATGSIVAIAANDWELAAERLDAAIEINELAAELYLWRSAVAAAQGDQSAAIDWLDDAAERFGDLDDRQARDLAAQYLSLLSFVGDREPDRAGLADTLTQSGVAAITRNAAGRDLEPGRAPDASLAAATATYEDSRTTVNLDIVGVPQGAVVAAVGFERPGDDAAWVQPSELFYTGPAVEGSGTTLRTPRRCVAVEYRFDLYVEGEYVNTIDVPGAAATC